MKRFIKLCYLLLLLKEYIKPEIIANQNNFFLNKNILPNFILSYKSKTFSNMVKELYVTQNDIIKYEPTRIKSILEKNNFPEYYNFFESTNVKKVVKDQGQCGSCWSIASTTALSYRFNKQGYNLDLSPQVLLSCYKEDCNSGASPINVIFNLIKNGTVTEKCLPYSSADGIVIDECPTKCKDGSEYKKYYGKSGFSTFYQYSKENYYNIVEVIINQLINYGPLVTSINTYEDFHHIYGTKNCNNYIYSHKTGSDSYGHALIIVGYGYEQSKYYWLVQNSWGEDFCDGGLVKIEFGQVGVERATFIEPYISENNTSTEEININLNIDKTCKISFNSSNNIDLDNNIKNSFELFAKNNDEEDSFYFQCGIVSLNNGNEKTCILNENYEGFYNKKKGNYQINNLQSLGIENKFNLEKSYTFYYYGVDLVYPFVFPIKLYVSESGSKIVFRYRSDVDDKRFLSKIYINKNSTTYLKDCKPLKIDDNILGLDYILYCNINLDEIKYFENSKNSSDNYLTYDVLCGGREIINAIVYKLDKEKYPVFRITKFIVSNNEYIQNDVPFRLIADIEGSISHYKTEDNTFVVLVGLEYKDIKQTHFGVCHLNKLSSIMNNYEILCGFVFDDEFKINYNNLYLYPYSYPNKNLDPFEVIIPDKIKCIVEMENDEEEPSKFKRSYSKFINFSSLTLLILILF